MIGHCECVLCRRNKETRPMGEIHQAWCNTSYPCHATSTYRPTPTIEQRARRQALERAQAAAQGAVSLSQFQAWIAVELKRIP